MALVTTGSIITYILEKLKSLAPNAVKDFLTKYFSPTFVEDVLGKLTDFQSYLGFLQPIVKGVEIIFNFLKPLIEAFAVALKSGGKLATKLIKENKMKKSDLKKLIKEQILNELETGKPEVVTLSKYLATAGKTALSSINDINELESVLNMIFDGMNTTLKSSSKLTPLLNKLKTKFK
jgi:hypothetical protein